MYNVKDFVPLHAAQAGKYKTQQGETTYGQT